MDLTRCPDKRRAFKPFNEASERFQTRSKSASAPGYRIISYLIALIFLILKIKDLVVMNLMLNKIVKYKCFIVLVEEPKLFQLLKQNVWH
jgi:hypothetical protein